MISKQFPTTLVEGMTKAIQQPLKPAQVADIAGSIATALLAIERLAVMVDGCTDLQDRGAMATGIECIAKYAGGLADMVNVAHGGAGILGDFNDWSRPGYLDAAGTDDEGADHD